MAVSEAKSPGITYQDLLDTDTHPVNPILRLQNNEDFGTHDVDVDRYLSQEFFDLEVEKVWRKVWQFACREEHIPHVGDTYVYDIADESILVVRSAPGEIRAFYNACLHRGRQLREESGYSGEVMRCAFHGFAWHHDGTLAEIPSAWDFPHVEPEKFCLPEVQVDSWGGFVFINMDPEAESLQEYLGDLPAHFEKWAPEAKFVQAHVAKVLRCNWKVAQEAFSEAYHVIATHPQIMPSIGDQNSQYDSWGNFSRAISPNATPSPYLTWEPTEQEVFDAFTDRRLDQDPVMEIPEGATARATVAAGAREARRSRVPNIDEYCDAELVDSMYYTLFPNFHPWGAFNRIVYRFRPYGTDPDMCIMECLFLAPFAGDRPPPADVMWIGPDEDFSAAIPVLGVLARVFNQDCFNLPKVQKGLKTMKKPGVTLANYQETKLRHFHTLLDRYITN